MVINEFFQYFPKVLFMLIWASDPSTLREQFSPNALRWRLRLVRVSIVKKSQASSRSLLFHQALPTTR